jgi:PAS domain S-box-containing protein
MSSTAIQSASAAGLVLTPGEESLAASVAGLAELVVITRSNLDRPGPTIIAASPGMSALTGYSVEELLGRTPRIFQGPLTDRAVLRRLRECCERGERFVGEAVNYRKDGRTYVHEWRIDPIRDEAGRITHFFSLHRDVTAERPFAAEWLEAEERASQALGQASEQMKAIAEAIIVLEKTKRAFQSKDLGELRKRLTTVSRAFGSSVSRPA